MAGRPRTQIKRLEEIEQLLQDARSRIFEMASKNGFFYADRQAKPDEISRAWGEAVNGVWSARRAVGVLLKRLRAKHMLPALADVEVDGYVEWLESRDSGHDGEFDDADDAAEIDDDGTDGAVDAATSISTITDADQPQT